MRAGSLVSLMPIMHDNLNNTFSFSAEDLPLGISINPTTGMMSGTIQQQPQSVTRFTTTISATGGGDIDIRAFDWIVLSGTAPVVLFAINDTYRTNDDITVLDPQLALSVGVTLYAPPQPPAPPNPPPNPLDPPPPPPPSQTTVTLSVPSGRSVLSMNEYEEGNTSIQLQMSDGEIKTIIMTPEEVSEAEDDVMLVAFVGGQQAGAAPATNVWKITIVTDGGLGHIRAGNTPAGMADRITVRDPTPYGVRFIGPAVFEKNLVATVLNQSAGYGRVGLWDPTTQAWWTVVPVAPNHPGGIEFSGGLYSSWIRGNEQTQWPCYGGVSFTGNLTLAVYRDGDEDKNGATPLAESLGFSVAAIPQAIKMSDPAQLGGRGVDTARGRAIEFGTTYKVTYLSDSLKQSDLDGVTISEKLVVLTRTGAFEDDVAQLDSDFLPATKTDERDRHYIRLWNPTIKGDAALKAEAIRVWTNDTQKAADDDVASEDIVFQYFVFTDARTGLLPRALAKVPGSGFKIAKKLTIGGDGKATLTVTKTPQADADGGIQAGEMPEAAQAPFPDKLE